MGVVDTPPPNGASSAINNLQMAGCSGRRCLCDVHHAQPHAKLSQNLSRHCHRRCRCSHSGRSGARTVRREQARARRWRSSAPSVASTSEAKSSATRASEWSAAAAVCDGGSGSVRRRGAGGGAYSEPRCGPFLSRLASPPRLASAPRLASLTRRAPRRIASHCVR